MRDLLRAFVPPLRRVLRAGFFAASVAVASAFAQISTSAGDDKLVGDFFPYRAFDQLAKTRIDVGGGTLEVAFGPGDFELSHTVVLDWVERSVRAVAGYFGRLPDPKSRLLIVPVGGAGIRGGTTYGYHGAASRIQLGHGTTQAQLTRDWVLVHELVHHAVPDLADRHHWLEEGLATYVEPIARVQAGELGVEKVWQDLVNGLPNGLPRAGDEGLDRTHTWGRTYWGGALFYLLADIEIHRRTDNRRGLQDAMRAVVAAGGNIGHSWPVERLLTTADSGTGVHVLTELYNDMKDKPHDVDLTALWQQLGVSMQGQTMRFDDAAPLAAIRHAITAPRPAHPAHLRRELGDTLRAWLPREPGIAHPRPGSPRRHRRRRDWSTAPRRRRCKGLLITPGFLDIHAHDDGQATWGPHLTPSSWHGMTTAVFANSGVGREHAVVAGEMDARLGTSDARVATEG